MKNKKLLVALLSLIKFDEQKFIDAANDENGDDSVLKEFKEKYQVFTTTDVETIKKNAKAAGVEEHFAKPDFDVYKDIPSVHANKLVGNKLEGKQKAWAEKAGIKDAKDIDELIDRLVTKSNEGKGEPDQELKNQNELLKKSLLEEQEKVKTVEQKYVADEINRAYTTELNSLPLDFDDEKLEKQRKLLKAAFNDEYKLEKKGDKTVVLKKNGEKYERVNDTLGEPLPLNKVLSEFAKENGFPFKEEDPGGRGDGSSGAAAGAGKNKLKGISWEATVEAANKALPEGKKLVGNSPEMVDLRTKWKAENN